MIGHGFVRETACVDSMYGPIFMLFTYGVVMYWMLSMCWDWFEDNELINIFTNLPQPLTWTWFELLCHTSLTQLDMWKYHACRILLISGWIEQIGLHYIFYELIESCMGWYVLKWPTYQNFLLIVSTSWGIEVNHNKNLWSSLWSW